MINKYKIVIACVCIAAATIACWYYGNTKYNAGYEAGHQAGYSKGYSDGYADRNKLALQEKDAVAMHTKAETKIVYQKIPYNGNDVQLRAEKPIVKISVNGKQQEIEQHSETADLAVKTEAAIKIKIPERKWKVGIGTDGHKAAYMLSTPMPFAKNSAVGLWVAGNREKCLGGVSISF